MSLPAAPRRAAVPKEAIMTHSKRTTTSRGRRNPRAKATHPHRVAPSVPLPVLDEFPDQPFAEGAEDQLDPDLRHRLISEAAFHRQSERAYNREDYDREDWLEAETAVDHVVVGPKSS
jgi:hypothetical protein